MAREEVQAYCSRCGRYIIHRRFTQDTAHAAHLIAAIFLCGLWLPVWLIIVAVRSVSNSNIPFLCSACGQAEGDWTPEQIAAYQTQAAVAAYQMAQVQAAEDAERSVRRAESWERWKARLISCATIPTRLDVWLRTAYGDDYVILYRSTQVVLYMLLPLCAAAVAWWVL